MPKPLAPDLSARPYSMTVERQMAASAEDIYDAWTRRFDKWVSRRQAGGRRYPSLTTISNP
ncbi:MAG: hypothetical protein R2832_19360 [Rhodothermales bacterium]